MRCIAVVPLLTSVLCVTCAGCRPVTWSGITEAVSSDSLIETADSELGIELRERRLVASSSSDRTETERKFVMTIDSGTRGQLLAAYKRAVEQTIIERGGELRGSGGSGGRDDVKEFSYDYASNGTMGLVRVYSSMLEDGTLQVITFCYEHRR